MSAELVAIIAATVSLGGLVTVQVHGIRTRLDGLADRVARMEGQLDVLMRYVMPPPAPRSDTDQGVA